MSMLKRAVRRYDLMRKELETDLEYQALARELQELEPHFQAAVDMLPQEHRDVIMEYIGVYGEMAERETELACYVP